MAAIKQSQLHQLIRRHVVDEFHAHALPGRPAGDEAILDHPLLEYLGDDGRRVCHAECRRHGAAVCGGRRRHDAIDHRTREAHLRPHPVGESLALDLGKVANCGL